jgi:hypothetical protein
MEFGSSVVFLEDRNNAEKEEFYEDELDQNIGQAARLNQGKLTDSGPCLLDILDTAGQGSVLQSFVFFFKFKENNINSKFNKRGIFCNERSIYEIWTMFHVNIFHYKPFLV